MTKGIKDPKKYKLIIFFDDDSTKSLLAKAVEKRGYDVSAFSFPKDCVVTKGFECACDKDKMCADIMIFSRHFGPYRALDFLEAQVRAGCRIPSENKLVICSSHDEKEEDRAAVLGIKMIYMPLTIAELNTWLDGCQKRLKHVK